MVSARSVDLSLHVSHAVKEQWCDYCRLPSDRAQLIYNGVQPRVDAPRFDTSSVDVPDAAYVFTFLGRLAPMKGLPYLLEAVDSLRTALDDFVVLVCGDGPERAAIEQRLADQPEVARHIRLLGWTDDISAILAATDCLVLPSVEWENLSLSVLEAAMCGVPAIVTDVGGMREAVLDGETGYVVPPRAADAFADAMRRMATDRTLTTRLGKDAQERASRTFSCDRMQRDYVRLMKTSSTSPHAKIAD